MSLFRKLRTLAGALVHKPFMPRQEKIDLDEEPKAPGGRGPLQDHRQADEQMPGLSDDQRVADLIAKQQREQADQGPAPTVR